MRSYVLNAPFAVGWLLAVCAGAAACSREGSGRARADLPREGGGRGAAPPAPRGNGAGVVDLGGMNPAPGCGNGLLTKDEACDDGNEASGDGCFANCRQVEPGYSCAVPGELCRPIARCGDTVLVFPELCDDGNRVAGDGCSSDCKLELGFKCEGAPSRCMPTVCGDGVQEGAESCEDGNTRPFDGCSSDCRNEPGCAGGPCTSSCGDGLVLAEGCDDGNTLDGDGCSSRCEPEPGFTCEQPALGETLAVPLVLRDFRYRNPSDFEPSATGYSEATLGLVGERLDAQGKPVFVGRASTSSAPFVSGPESFATWYRDTPGVNSTTYSKLILYRNPAGAYVNRAGAHGEQFLKTATAYYCGSVGAEQVDDQGLPIPCTSKHGPTDCERVSGQILSCSISNGSYIATYLLEAIDGNPLFFPVDAETFTPASERASAVLPAPMYSASWDAEPGSPLHNFSFTSEAGYWFRYDSKRTYLLEFTGDDDVWVFINKRLAVDLGGIHTPVTGSVMLDAASAARFGLEDGRVYEIRVFQAERQTTSSSYKLTLDGFNTAPSDCRPTCGDSIVSIGEECDDGVNDGGYGECNPGCRLGEFCGDGVQQAGEDCDDGVNDGAQCPSGCRFIVIE